MRVNVERSGLANPNPNPNPNHNPNMPGAQRCSLKKSCPPVTSTTGTPSGQAQATSARQQPPLTTTTGSRQPSRHSAGSVTCPPREPHTRQAIAASATGRTSCTASSCCSWLTASAAATVAAVHSPLPPPPPPPPLSSSGGLMSSRETSTHAIVRASGSNRQPAHVARLRGLARAKPIWLRSMPEAAASCSSRATWCMCTQPGG